MFHILHCLQSEMVSGILNPFACQSYARKEQPSDYVANFDDCDDAYISKPHSICFLPQHQPVRQRKCFFFQCDTLTRAALSGVLSTMAN